ncbi:NAD(P)H-dependent glycerol-3-phosphate dehydrogenase [Nocardia carnea]|uniref:NAD(P)H-dependent glycerol-3-phosphate dehydrogenase n=1 Tax=Nocardia carnea TaxID=37328 RepID=UPI00245673D7|nr:NAD(P)H-dependent glycerol-3-phosphate dehydrogenase [Nocardia carnea]
MTRAAVMGAGSWGTTLAKVLADAGTEVTIWARRPEVAEALATDHRNPYYLPGVQLPPVTATADYARAMAGADIVVLAVPSQALRGNLKTWAPAIGPDATLLSVAKGIESGTLLRMSEVIAEVTGADPGRIAVLSGPNLAGELAAGQPAATVVGCTDAQRAAAVQQACVTSYFRPYTNTDVVGCEIGGACKNVIALACGIASGMGFGDNSIAALMTRGLAEIIRLGMALGAEPVTLAGLAGVGDLIATCTSPLSRNRSFGQVLGSGGSMQAAQEATHGQIAEGVKSCTSVRALAVAHGVEMPLTEAVHQVCHEGLEVQSALEKLLGRQIKPE